MRTLRDGLLSATPATSDAIRSVSVPGVETRDGRPFSLFLPAAMGVSSSFIRKGLEGSIASLLGAGVREGGGRVKVPFDNVGMGGCFAGVV